MSEPGAPAKGKYHGPGWAEWLLGFAATALAATQLRSFLEDVAPQTALSYYYQEPGIRVFHVAAMTVDLLIVLCVAFWIFVWRKAVVWGTGIMIFCALGAGIIWIELIRAVQPISGRVYQLEGLPFYPVNNMGILGAGVFVGYIALKLPMGEIGKFAQTMTKIALWIGMLGVQWILFEQVAGGRA
ncbi:MAG: hypothetical protein KF824_08990 [Fimbriimonadaceae bacterium]|nr:MAG: hypothetical protein KF824_08990 [Fimbriimonadaceae bacterium]